MRLIPTRAILAGQALHRKILAKPKLDSLEGWVVSPGGVGTTFLMEYLSRFMVINDFHDNDGLKHWPRPPDGSTLAKAPQIVFVTGDVDVIAASIARRNWVATQSVKLGCIRGSLLTGDAQQHAFKQALEAQITSWMACDSDKVLTVAYDDLWDRAGDIGAHLGLDSARFAASFPARRPRHVSVQPDVMTKFGAQ